MCHQKNGTCKIYQEGDFTIGPGNKNNNSFASLYCSCGKFCGWLPSPLNGESEKELADNFVKKQWRKWHNATP